MAAMSEWTPAEAHARNVAGGLSDDPVQAALTERLTQLRAELIAAGEVRNGLARLLRRRAAVRGLYLWGGVGRGKTYLMDLFHESLPFEDKERLHFHRFMQRVHGDLRALGGRSDPLDIVAERFAAEARVICFDEFFVSDIGDAMILAGLLRGLFERGVTMVAPPWCIRKNAPSCSAAFQNGRNSGASNVRPFTWSPIIAPFRPSCVTLRSNSSMAAPTSCIGSVASPAKRSGLSLTSSATWSLQSRAMATVASTSLS